jgi:hypothetical protein
MYNFYVKSFSLKLPKLLKIHFWHLNSTFSKIFITVYQFTSVKIVHLQNNTFTY